MLSRSQKAVMEAIERLTEKNGCPPTYRELARALRIGTSSAYVHVRNLKDKGYIEEGLKADTRKKARMIQKVRDMVVKVKYFDPACKLERIEKGDWIDLHAREDMYIMKGASCCIPLGVAMELPEGHEAHIIPRSSTFKTWGLIQTNSMGLIDNSYKGDGDEWMMPVFATADTEIRKGDRVCQFRIVEKQTAFKFVEVEKLGNADRGGFGSTGVN